MARSFDFHTEKRNKNGQIVSSQPYTLHVIDGQQYLERPPQSGQFYNSDGSMIAAEEIPGKLQPKLRVPAKDQEVEVGPVQNVSQPVKGGVEVKQVESVEAGDKSVQSSDKKAEDKRK